MTSFAIAAFLAAASLSSSPAHATITVTGPLTTNSGTNYVTIGAWNFFGSYYLTKCEDGVFAVLTTSGGAAINLGSSPNLNDNVEFKIFQNGNDDVRRVNSGGMSCQGLLMEPLQSNGFYISMWLSGGNDYTPSFNLGGPMIVYGGAGDDGITINTSSSATMILGEDGNDQLATYGNTQDWLFGDAGNDSLTWAGSGFNRCDGGSGTDGCSNSTCATGQMVNCEIYLFP